MKITERISKQTLLGTLALALFVTSCATMHSVKINETAQPAADTMSTQGNEGLIYFLPKGYVDLVGTLGSTSKTVLETNQETKSVTTNTITTDSGHYSFNITPIIEPDASQPFLLRPNTSAWGHDTYQFTVANGLLSSINSTNGDQTGSIILKLAETAGFVSKGSMPGVTIQREPESSKTSSTDQITRPKNIHCVIDLNAPPDDTNSFESVTAELKGYSLDLYRSKKVEFDQWTNAPGATNGDNITELDGIYYRCKLPVTIRIADTNGDTFAQTFLLPNKNPILSFVPRRSALVNQSTSLNFQDGTLTSVGFDKPSTVLAWVSLPLDTVKAFLSAPTEMLQLKLNYANTNQALTSADDSILKNQLSELQSKVALIQYQQTNGVAH